METNLFKSINLIRCVSGANLNLFRYTAMVLVLLLGVGNAWANSHSTHYGKAVLNNATGNGTVYLSTSSSSNSGQSGTTGTAGAAGSTSYITWNCGASSGNDSKTYYARGTANDGYYFAGYATSSTATSYTASSTGKSFSASSTNSGSPTTTTIYGFFKPVTVTAAPSNVNINATDPSATYNDAAGTVVSFTTANSNKIGDFTTAESGDARWVISAWTRASASSATFNYKFVGNGSYGTNNRTFTKTVTLTSKGDASSTKTCTLTAKYPNPRVVACDAEATDLTIYPTFKAADATQAAVEKTAVFDVVYADNANNFSAAFSGATGSGTWTVTGISVDQNNQKATVTYTFNGNKSAGTHTAVLTLTANNCQGWDDTSAAGGASATVTLTAENTQEATDDAKVIASDGETLIYQGDWVTALGKANTAANAGCTLQLLRNVHLNDLGQTGTQATTNTFTLDLNGKILSGEINGSVLNPKTSGKTLTIKDSKTGGKIQNISNYNGVLYAINLSAGTLNVESGYVYVENQAQYAYGTSSYTDGTPNKGDMQARAIHMAATSTVNVSGGKIHAVSSRNAFGIREESSKANNTTLNVTGGEIIGEAPAYAYGIYASGKVNISGGSVTALLNDKTVDGNTTYTANYWNDYTLHRYGYGIQMFASSNATAANCYFGTLTITGGTINAINVNATTNSSGTLQSEHTYGIYMNISATGAGAGKTAPDGTKVMKACAIGSMENATVNVTHAGSLGYGILAVGSYNSFDNKTTPFIIKNSTINVTTNKEAYGVYASAYVNWSSTLTNLTGNGGCTRGEFELTNVTINATAEVASGAYCAWASCTSGTVANAKATTGSTSTGNGTYYGEYAVAGKITVNSGTFTADAKTSSAYGIGSSDRAKCVRNVNGVFSGRDAATDPQGSLSDYALTSDAEAYPELYIHGGNFSATTGTTTAIAVKSGGNTLIDGGTFNAFAGTTTAYGLYVTAGKTVANGVTFPASATTVAYGVYVYGGISDWSLFPYYGEVELNNCNATATARTTTDARGVYVNGLTKVYTQASFDAMKSANNSNYKNYGDYAQVGERAIVGKATINGGTYSATAETTTAYGIIAISTRVSTNKEAIASSNLVVKNATVIAKTNTGTTAYGIQPGGGALIENCTVSATAGTTTASGVRAIDKTTVIKNSTITAKGTDAVYGLEGYVDASTSHGYCWHGDFDLSEAGTTKVTAESTGATKAWAIYLNAKAVNVASGTFAGDYATAANATINGGTYIAKTNGGTNGYAISLTGTQTKGTASAQPEVLVTDGKFNGSTAEVGTAGVVGHLQLKGGYYVHNTNLSKYIPEGYEEVPLASDRPEYTEGYRYEVGEAGMHGIDVCQIGSTKYKTLEEALQVVMSGQTIYMIANYIMNTPGDYILPSGATLLIPYKDGQKTIDTHPTRVYNSYTAPVPYKKLTLGTGVNLDVLGTIQAGGLMSAKGQTDGYNGMPTDAYGWLYLSEGSTITLENGAKLYAWGYVTGKGEIDAKSGSSVYEMFQVKDWRGGSCTLSMYNNNQKVFPLNQYAVQNIECPIKFRPGSAEMCDGTVNASSAARTFNDVKFIGAKNSGAMFEMDANDVSANTWVRKWYDVENDKQVYEANSSVNMNSITLSLNGYSFSSSNYVLPITNNMKIHLLSGNLYITQNTELLPGAEIEIDKMATAYINSGKSLYVFDIDEWNAFTGTTHTYTLPFSPSWTNGCPRSRTITKDAAVNVHGTFVVNGSLYTTAGGANIFSTNEDAGTITYASTVSSSQSSVYVANNTGPTYTERKSNPAWLKNGDGTYAYTSGTVGGKSWAYSNDQWQCWSKDGCFFMDAQDKPHAKPAAYVELTSKTPDANKLHHDAATGTRNFVWDQDCYWWEVVTEPTAEGYYRSINADNNGKYNYYYYDSSAACWKIKTITVTWNINGSNTNYSVGYGTKPEWLGATPTKTSSSSDYVWRWDGWTQGGSTEVIDNKELPIVTENTTFTAHFYEKYYEYNVTFKNSDGTILDSRNWRAGTTPSYEGTPTKNATVDYTYEFNGSWSPAIATVTKSATYTAQYTATPRAYTITFLNYDMSVLGTAEVVYNGTPSNATYLAAVAPKTEDPYKPDNSAFSFEFAGWRLQGASSNGFAQVKGDQTYVAQFNQTTKKYKVSFVDDDGETVLHYLQLEYGQTPSYTWANPSKQDAEWTYTFANWDPSEFAQVEGAQTYTAVYNKTKREYTITWKDGDGNTLKTDQVAYGSTPSYSGATPTKAPTNDHSYVFNNTWSPAIVAVVGEATYTAQFNETPRQYRVTWDAATNGGTCGTEYSDFSYNAAIGTLPIASKEGHTFNGWFTQATGGTQITTATKVTADVTYHAQFTVNPYTITFDSNGGSAVASITQNYGTAVTAPANPTREGYTFNGWSPAVPSTMPVNGLTCVAQWTVNPYTITFDSNGGSAVASITQNYGTAVTAPANPTREGYTFNGWSPSVPSTMPVNGLTCVAQWTVNPYSITFDSNGGSSVASITQNYGTAVTAPANPTREGYTFNGWSPSVPSTMPVNGLNCVAQWTINQCLLTVLANNDTYGTVTGSGTYDYGTNVTITATPKSGFKFVKWNDDNTNASREVTVTADVTFTATFDYDIANYTVRHLQQNIYDDGYTEVASETKSGTIGEQTVAAAKTYTGFIAQPFDQQTIALENTEVNIYYNRKTFTISWIVKLNGETVASKEETLRYGAAPSFGTDPTKEPDDQWEYSFSGWKPNIAEVTANQTYEGTFDAIARTYDVTWKNADGTLIEKEDNVYTWGAQPSFPGSSDPVYTGNDPSKVYIFRGWKYERTGVEYKNDAVLPGVAGDETYTAVYTQMTAPIDVENGDTKEIETNTTTPTTTVHEGGMLKVQAGKALTTTTFILEASANASGQIIEDGTIEAEHVYYDLKLNSPRRHWHAFGVPWKVDLAANPLTEVETGRTFVLGNDYDIIWYNTTKRASSGPGAHCWEYVAHHDKTLTPGQGYMIAFTRDVQTIRFVKASDAPIIYNQEVTVTAEGEGNNQGINALANPMAYHATLNAGPTVGYVHDGGEIGSDGYEEYDIEGKSYVVGKTVYIQVQSNTTVAIAQSNAAPISKTLAPARRKAVTDKEYLSLNDYYRISISGAATDGGSVYVLPEEDKEDKYVVGHDLAKFGMSTKKAQIWIRRYDANLGLHTITPTNGEAEFPINLYAPTAGEYTIANAFSPDDEYTVYLTRDGEAIWNLSDSPYTMTFNKGTVNGYGIRLAKKAPQIATGVDEAVVDAKGETRKVLVNDKVFIIRGDQVYSVDGQLVK